MSTAKQSVVKRVTIGKGKHRKTVYRLHKGVYIAKNKGQVVRRIETLEPLIKHFFAELPNFPMSFGGRGGRLRMFGTLDNWDGEQDLLTNYKGDVLIISSKLQNIIAPEKI
jgi:hypothetical protein